MQLNRTTTKNNNRLKKKSYSHYSNIRNGNIVYISQVLEREREFCGKKKMSPNVINTHFNLGILCSYRCKALNPFGRGKGWGTFLASSTPLPYPTHYSVDLLATTNTPKSDRSNHRYKNVKELKVTIPPPALASYLNSFLSEMICAWGR